MKALLDYDRQTQALGQIAGRLGWDQETMMAPGSAAQRGEEMAAMESVLHARRSSAEFGDLIASATPTGAVEEAQLREIKRGYERATKVPGDLAAEIAKVTSGAQGTWAAARAANDATDYLPVFKEVLHLKQEEGAALADGGPVYDAMLQDYEPGATQVELQAMFDALRPGLIDLRAAIKDRPAPPVLEGTFAEDGQLKLSTKLAEVFGYNFDKGRIDKAVHPFSSGSGHDVRITTRTAENDPFNCFYSTVHEVGHACYEQNVHPDYALTSIGHGASMGVHESQSRIYENQLGRSEAFTTWLYGQMTETFGDFGVPDAQTFYAIVNRVSDGYIRTEADEVQYNLHVLLRFDLERALVSGDLAVDDLEAAWNDRFASDFGYAVDMPSNGWLQDVHWSVGLFGYFPTYSLGNVYAGCLHKALQADVADLDDQLRIGKTTAATGWLREKLQVHGSLKTPQGTIQDACGFAPSEAPLLDYLSNKFGNLYDL